ncbi:Thiosulfate sulfurtransferase, rhodanese [Richelia intracellularis HH01]|uniref:Thiosulfate sulfurtransferase, rhodanese n=2 Tax=Richelia TaxID=98443 RepID=M1WZQ6_9NOST|nr:Thiosulfate sulfurtransferase, rhodanese [Richelia intracellularis HH01]
MNKKLWLMNNHLVVSCDWLKKNLADPQIVIADCRFSLGKGNLGRHKYQHGHIQGSYYLDLNHDLSSPVRQHGGRHPLPKPELFSQKLSAIGIERQKTLVVAYDDSFQPFASRLWWLLKYMGHEQVRVLDGGFNAWLTAGYDLTDTIPNLCEGNFIPNIQPQMVAERESVEQCKDLPGVVLVDSRTVERYKGIQEPIDKVAGHIPGAVNFPWQQAIDCQGYFFSSLEQRQRWLEIEKIKDIIVYCGSGVTACVNLLSLELAGIQNAKLYTGGWSDWISY